MAVKTGLFLRRTVAMLCVALMAVFSQAAVASSIGAVQHLFGGEHHHMMFSDMTLDFDHHPDGDRHNQHGHHDHQPDADDTAPGHAAGHHHHHGDVGSTVFVVGVAAPDRLPACHGAHSPASDRLTVNARQFLPERPPKDGLSRV
jgi:hypothetical protein